MTILIEDSNLTHFCHSYDGSHVTIGYVILEQEFFELLVNYGQGRPATIQQAHEFNYNSWYPWKHLVTLVTQKFISFLTFALDRVCTLQQFSDDPHPSHMGLPGFFEGFFIMIKAEFF